MNQIIKAGLTFTHSNGYTYTVKMVGEKWSTIENEFGVWTLINCEIEKFILESKEVTA